MQKLENPDIQHELPIATVLLKLWVFSYRASFLRPFLHLFRNIDLSNPTDIWLIVPWHDVFIDEIRE
jgi:hypothetical protein